MTGDRRTAGFTLTELLVVMTIIGVFLTIAVPRYFRTVERPKETVLRRWRPCANPSTITMGSRQYPMHCPPWSTSTTSAACRSTLSPICRLAHRRVGHPDHRVQDIHSGSPESVRTDHLVSR